MRNNLKEIPKFPNYCASKDGKIWSKRSNKFLSPSFSSIYGIVILSSKGKKNYRKVHRLILETYIGPCPEGMEACHNNGIRSDNRLENLRWDTKSNNQRDSVVHGTNAGLKKKGENHHNSKLTESDIHSIRLIWKYRLNTQKNIAKAFRISRGHVGDIVNKKKWKHI